VNAIAPGEPVRDRRAERTRTEDGSHRHREAFYRGEGAKGARVREGDSGVRSAEL
jgi:hypothetical protein